MSFKLKAVFFSGVAAGVTAGVSAGIKATKNGRNFWSGKRPEVNTISTLTPKGIEPVGLPKPKGGDLSGLKPLSIEDPLIGTIQLDEVVVSAKPGFNINNAVNTMNLNALSGSVSACGRYVRYGLESGFGLEKNALLGQTPKAAGDYGSFLESRDFTRVNPNILQPYSPRVGDIMVFDRTLNHQWGHIQMFNGSNWVSDFIQNTPYPWIDYRGYSIFRW